MNFQLIRRDVPKLVIDNKFAIPGVVLIFPITRASGLANGSWHKFMELIDNQTQTYLKEIDWYEVDFNFKAQALMIHDTLEGSLNKNNPISRVVFI